MEHSESGVKTVTEMSKVEYSTNFLPQCPQIWNPYISPVGFQKMCVNEDYPLCGDILRRAQSLIREKQASAAMPNISPVKNVIMASSIRRPVV
jgi:hypothetical protein